MGPAKTEASLKNEALTDLMQLIMRYGEGKPSDGRRKDDPPAGGGKGGGSPKGDDTIESTKAWLAQHTASEVLNRLGWNTNPEKILLLAGFHEATGGEVGWRSADINKCFEQAREQAPGNFTRDIRAVIGDGSIGAVTPRTYKVGRAGWNKIADGIKALSEE